MTSSKVRSIWFGAKELNFKLNLRGKLMRETQILIVEDERIVAEDIRESLQRMGYKASVVSSGKMAIKKVKEIKPDLLLMDILLKGEMDGIEASRQIRSIFNIEIALHKHRIEKELRESKEWFSTTLNSLGDAVIATDPKGNVVFMNPIAQFF